METTNSDEAILRIMFGISFSKPVAARLVAPRF
jgi:hypothetical protein